MFYKTNNNLSYLFALLRMYPFIVLFKNENIIDRVKKTAFIVNNTFFLTYLRISHLATLSKPLFYYLYCSITI